MYGTDACCTHSFNLFDRSINSRDGELTLGLNWKPSVPSSIAGFVVRPEVRVDDALNGAKPFENGTSGHQFTIAADVILPFGSGASPKIQAVHTGRLRRLYPRVSRSLSILNAAMTS